MKHLKQLYARHPSFRAIEGLARRYRDARPYLVGGVLRDAVLGRPTKDLDYVVAGLTASTLEQYLRRYGRVDAVGKIFGVLKFRPKGASLADTVDVALPRTEHSISMSGRYRDFAVRSDPGLSITDDLQRRDFTMNAMAWDIRESTLVDPNGGLADIAAQKIRAVGSPKLRFQEDYSRLLRALRLSVQLGFDIEDSTWRALRPLVPKLAGQEVPKESVAREFLRAFATDPMRTMDLFDRAGVWKALVPELVGTQGCRQDRKYHSEGDVWTHTRLALEVACSSGFRKEFSVDGPSLELLVALLFHDLGKPIAAAKNAGRRTSFYGHEELGGEIAQNICQRLVLSSYEGEVDAERVRWLIASHMLALHTEPSQLDPLAIEAHFLSQLRPSQLLVQLMYADQSASRNPNGGPSLRRYHAMMKHVGEIRRRGFDRHGRPTVLLDGGQIMEILGIPAGRLVGSIHDTLRAEQLRGNIRTRAQAKRFIQTQYALQR